MTPARVSVGPGGRDLRLSGDLVEGTAARVAELLAGHTGIERIHLTSDGGLVSEGVAIGDLVSGHRLDTYVPDVCASACTLVFVRGRNRYLAEGARLGFHAPYGVAADGRRHAVEPVAERAAYAAAGVPAAFVDRIMAAPMSEIWIPDLPELRAAGIVTESVDLARFPDSSLDADASAGGARAAILLALPILRRAGPRVLAPLVRWYRDGYEAGRSEPEDAAGLRRLTGAYLRARFRMAGDGVVLALARDVLDAGESAATLGDRDCGAIADGDLVALDKWLRDADSPRSGLAPLLARTPAHMPATASPAPAARSAPGAGDCMSRLAGLRRALARPLREAATTLRATLLAEPVTAVGARTAP